MKPPAVSSFSNKLKRKRILHLIDHLDLGGAQAVLLDLVILLRQAGWEVEVAALHGEGEPPFASALKAAGVPLHILSSSKWPPRYLRSFWKLRQRFDLFHFHLLGTHLLLQPLVALFGEAPCLFHDHASSDWRFRGVANSFLDTVAHFGTRHTIAISEEVEQFLTTYEGVDPGTISVIPNGVNIALFTLPSASEKLAARRALGIEEQEWVVGTVGRLAPEKNQELFLRVAVDFLTQGGEGLFLLAGRGLEEERLRFLAEQFGKESGQAELVARQVRFLGSVSDRQQLFRALDLMLIPSRYEGLPMVLLEAMASGVPVISSDLPGIRRVLLVDAADTSNLDTVLGSLLPVDDQGAFLKALGKAFQDWQARQRGEKEAILAQEQHQQKLHNRVKTAFSAQQAAQEVGQLYQQLLLFTES